MKKFIATIVLLLTLGMYVLPHHFLFDKIPGRSLLFQVRAYFGAGPTFSPNLKVFLFDDNAAAIFPRGDFENLFHWFELLRAVDRSDPSVIIIDKTFFDTKYSKSILNDVKKISDSLKTPIYTTAINVSSNLTYKAPLEEKYFTKKSEFKESYLGSEHFAENNVDEAPFIYAAKPEVQKIFSKVGHAYSSGNGNILPYITTDRGVLLHVAIAGVLATKDKDQKANYKHFFNQKEIPVNYLEKDYFYKNTFSVIDLLQDMQAKRSLKNIDDGDYVVILPKAYTSGTDFLKTPVGFMPGGHTIVSQVNTILTGNPIVRERLYSLIYLLCICGGVFLAFSQYRRFIFWIYPLAAFGLTILTPMLFFVAFDIELPMAFGCIFLVAMLVPGVLFLYRELVSQKFQMEGVLKNCTDERIALKLVDDPEYLGLGGTVQEVTVLFADMKGFSTISQFLTPSALKNLISETMGAISEPILENKGYINKFIGDAIMAFWSPPFSDENNAELAVKSAMQMLDSVARLNEKFKKMGYPEVKIRIGLSTGFATVGNIGTNSKLDYTAIGDSVNQAARLQDLNKLYDSEILISKSTKEKLKQSSETVRFLEYRRLRGQYKKTGVYQIVSSKYSEHQQFKTTRNNVSKAINLLKKQKFQDALDHLEKNIEIWPGDKVSIKLIQKNYKFMSESTYDSRSKRRAS